MERYLDTPDGRIYFASPRECPARGYGCPADCTVPDIIPDNCPAPQ